MKHSNTTHQTSPSTSLDSSQILMDRQIYSYRNDVYSRGGQTFCVQSHTWFL